MSGIDQLLSLVVAQGANELRLAVDQEPQMFANGQRKRLTMAATSEFALRHLVSEILTTEHDARLRNEGRLVVEHAVADVGNFRANFVVSGDGVLKIIFQLAPKTERTAVPPTPAASIVTAITGPTDTKDASIQPGTSLANTEPEAAVTHTNALRQLLAEAYERRASDIHLADGEKAYLRVDGKLAPISLGRDRTVEELLLFSESTRQLLLTGRSVDVSLDVEKNERIRVCAYRSENGLTAAIRLLPKEAPDIAKLGLPMPIDDLVQISHGLVLVCGATGSGKSTTLAALAKLAVSQRSIVLVTLEDPIEYAITPPEHSIVRRRQIGRDVVSFQSGLRDALRGDPDVILVGELRDPETIQLALTAAETGHLVLASLHSGGAASAVERIIDAYPSDRRSQIRVELADALRAVIAQKLLPRAKGAGRVVAMEIMRMTHAAGNIIREGRTAQIGTLLQSGKREGMLSMDRCLADYVQNGVISLEQAHAAAYDKESLSMYLAK